MRAVVDTNVWVSAILNPAGYPARVLQAYRDGRFTLVISTPLLAELREVLLRPRMARKYGVTAEDADELTQLLGIRALVMPVVGAVKLCRDPDDDVVLETALRARAGALVSRDEDLTRAEDLTELLAEGGVAVLSVARLLRRLDAEAPAE